MLARADLVAIAADGRRGDAERGGSVHVYERDDDAPPPDPSWRRRQVLVEPRCDGGFGASLALAGDDGLLVGCPMDDAARGAVYYYAKSGDDRDGAGRYVPRQKIAAGDGESLQKFGGNHRHLAVNANGDLLAVGTMSSSGMDEVVYVFALVDGLWSEVAEINSPKNT